MVSDTKILQYIHNTISIIVIQNHHKHLPNLHVMERFSFIVK